MTLDDADTIRRFVSQIKRQLERSDLTGVTSPSTTQHDQPTDQHDLSIDTADAELTDGYEKSNVAKTPPHTTVAGQDNHRLASPEAHPQPSPHVSGIKAPYNTPKTAASSPRLVAANTHNQDVAEAFSDYVNTVNTRPLSESMWAPGSARHKPSVLSGARSTNALTPIKAVEPNPAINDTFDRMSFRAADPGLKIGENLIGDHVTRYMPSKTPPSAVNKFSILADKTQGGMVDDVVQAKFEKASDEDLERSAQTDMVDKFQEVQIKADAAAEEDLPDTVPIDRVGKENEKPSTSKANVPPHLRATGVSSQQPVKAETESPCPEGLGLDAKGKVATPSSVKDTVRATTNGVEHKITTGSAGPKPLTDPPSQTEDLENKQIFNTWPKQEERSKPAAKVRTVIIKDLPRDSTATFVASIVYGGPLEEIQIRASGTGALSAAIRFMDAGDCMKFYEETSNGLVYKKDAKGCELVLFVQLGKEVDVVGGLLQGYIASGVTRCVRAVGVEVKWDWNDLVKMAERKNRKVEKIVDGQNAGGARSVLFRFCRVEDAVQFKGALSRDEAWEHCNIHYAADPCASASGVHLEQ